MRLLVKPMLAIVTLLGLSTAAAVAQPGPAPDGGPGWGPGDCPMGPMMHGDPEQWRQRHGQRMQQLEQQLDLRTDEQRSAWQAFVTAVNGWHESMRSHGQGMAAEAATPERFNRMAQTMRQGADSIQPVAAASRKLYDVLDEAQRKTLDQFFAKGPKMGRRHRQ